MPLAGMSPRSAWPIGPSNKVSAVFASRNRNAMSTMPVCIPDTMLTSLPSWPPENTWMRTAPPVLAATISENFVATVWVGCSGVSGWPSLRVTAPWANARSDRQIAGMAAPNPAAAARNCLRVIFEVMDVLLILLCQQFDEVVDTIGFFKNGCFLKNHIISTRYLLCDSVVLMVWIVGAVSMIFFGIALLVSGLVVDMLGYSIVGGIVVLAGIFLLVS